MKTEGTNLLVLTMSAFWGSSRWPKHVPRYWPFVRGIHRSRWIPRTKACDAELVVFFVLRPNKRLSKQPRGWWFETPPWSLWRQCNDDSHFADDIFTSIFLNDVMWIPLTISLKFVPKDQMNNIPSLVQIMAWCRSGDKPLSEPIIVILLTHVIVPRPQWVKIVQVVMKWFWIIWV